MSVIFEGEPPYALPVAQSATATAQGETVELTVRVSLPAQQPLPVPIQIGMTWKVALALANELFEASKQAEIAEQK